MRARSLRKHVDAAVAAGEEHLPELERVLTALFLEEGEEAADRFEAAARVEGFHASAPTATSAMVAVYPTDEQAALMASAGTEPPGEIHCTIAFLGEVEPDQAEVVLAALARVAPEIPPLEGTIGGVAAFGDNGKGFPSILLPDVDGLAELRQAVCDALDDAGVSRMTNHGWTPHITLSYTEEPSPPPAWLIGRPVSFGAVSVSVGDVRRDVPLGGSLLAAGAGSADTDVESEIARVAAANPDVDYGETAWNAETGTVLRVVGDGTDCDYGEAEFLAIDGVEKYEHEHEALPDGWWDAKVVYPEDPPRWVVEKDLGYGRNLSVRHLTADAAGAVPEHPGWPQPHADELVDSKALVAKFRDKADPVRQAVIASVAKPVLESAGIAYDATNPFIHAVSAKIGQHVSYIADTTQLNVARIVRDSYEAGLSIPDTAEAIRAGMKAAAPVRATLIARTEMTSLTSGASLAAVGVVSDATGDAYSKRWLTAPGAQFPRHEDYDGLDGQTTGLQGVFNVGGSQMQYPGDPDGPPDEVCNCRCTLVYLDRAGDEADDEGDGGGDSLAAALPFRESVEPEGGDDVSGRARIALIGRDKSRTDSGILLESDALVAAAEHEAEQAQLRLARAQELAATGFKDYPLSDRDVAWDAAAADKRVRDWAGADDGPNAKYATAFFWKDATDGGADAFGDYKLGFVDIVDGKPTAIWKGVTAAAGAIQGARGGVKIPDGDVAGVKAHIGRYYSKAADQYGDDTITPPWSDKASSSAEVMAEAGTHVHIHLHPNDFVSAEAVTPTPVDTRPVRTDQVPEPDDLGTNASQKKWQAILCPEGQATDDGRVLAPGSIGWRDLPLSLMAMLETSEGGHIGAQLAGRIDRIWRDDATDLVMAEGVFDDGEFGQEVARLVENRTLRGNSVDLAITDGEYGPRDSYVDADGGWLAGVTQESAAAEPESDLLDVLFADEKQIFVVWNAVIGMSTVCPFPAFSQAMISLTAAGQEDNEWSVGERKPMRWEIFVKDSLEIRDALTAAAAGIAPVEPPASWFENPALEELTPLTVDDDGRVYGHAWAWGTCHIGVSGGCTTPPYSDTDYACFLTKQVVTEEGDRVSVGTITLGTGHADIRQNPKAAVAHYDNTGVAVADVAFGEDEFGGWFAGAVRPEASASRVRELRGASVSGDWRGVKGNKELVALLAVNVPGFPVPRAKSLVASGDDGEVEFISLIAAGVHDGRTLADLTDADRSRLTALSARATGGLAALADLATRPLEMAAASLPWDSELGAMDIMSDISADLNPADTWRWWVVDVAIGGGSVILCDGDSNEYWVATYALGDDKEPQLAPFSEWVAVESEWVKSEAAYAALGLARTTPDPAPAAA